VSKVDPNQAVEGIRTIPVDSNRDVDMLFVIDNSGSMAEEQASLAANFGRFINVLETIEGGLPSVHIGVISTDVGAGPYNISGCSGNGDNGVLQSAPRGACDPPNNSFIIDIDDEMGGRTTNYTGSLADTFSCIARLGVDGCGFEQPLEAMRRALDGSNPSNAAFLRPDAYLAVIFITDEDDCSTADTTMFDTAQNSISDPLGPLSSFRCFEFGVRCEPDEPRTPGPRQDCEPRDDSQYMYDVRDYVTFLKSLKEDPRLVFVAGIIGNRTPVTVGVGDQDNPELEPSCVTSAGEAAPAVRLAFFLDQFPQRATTTTICNEDLSDALVLIAKELTVVFGNPCLVGNLDTDPDTAGVQYDCQVSQVRFQGEDREEETVLQECSSDTPQAAELPCWRLVVDAHDCSDTETQLSLVVERSGATVPIGTDVVVRCVVE